MNTYESLPSPPHFGILVLQDLSEGAGGFLRRVSRRVCTVDPQGKQSRALIYDEVDRRALDAVVVVAHFEAKGPSGHQQRFVVLRSAIRPPFALRPRERSPVPEKDNRGLWEAPAGLVEPNETGQAGLRAAAVRELWEETGFLVSAQALKELGPSALPAPGVIAERHFFFHVEVDPATQEMPPLDGSPLEEAGVVIAVSLSSCLEAARQGELSDTKTELALRRLVEVVSDSSGARS
ncbi:MAG TPA: NUDIX hydrolase [Polyangiaceae bacterium]|nr:NUDIX hydrolase [Polyangiaceae bacterium]